MRRIARLAISAILPALALASTASAQVSQGNQPFVPTRLEWLELYLNAGKGLAFSPEHGYGLTYAVDPFHDSLAIIVLYDPEKVERETLQAPMATARRTVDGYVRKRGWESWLKVDEKFLPLAKSQPLPAREGEPATPEPGQ